MPLFTIITVCYNAEKCIENTMRSVLNQTCLDFEYLLIDGKSKDNTICVINDVLKEYNDRNVFFVSEPDKGIYDAMNKGISIAQGQWINFMNAGDYFYNNTCLEELSGELSSDYCMVVGDMVLNLNNIFYRIKCEPFYEHLPLHQEMGFTHQSSFVRADLAKQNPFNLHFKLAADYNMVISFYRMGYKFHYVPLIIAYYDMTGISVKNKKSHIKETFEIDYPDRKFFNFVLIHTKFCKHIVKSMMKKIILTISPNLMYKYRSDRNGYEKII
ncbi:glycosyltransferase family 2 protein [Phocaeicola sp.]